MSKRIACDKGWIIPAAAPWITRNWINIADEGATAQSADAKTKRMIEAANSCLAPKRRRNQPVRVAMTAAAQR